MRPQVLIVDDDEAVLSGLAANLDAEGYEVLPAASARDALDLLETKPVDLVLTDLVMEGMDGLSLLRMLVRDRPGLPVVVITGHGSATNAIEAVREGAADFIQKPARADEIAHRLRTVLEAHRLKRQLLHERDRARDQRRQAREREERARRTAALRRMARGLHAALHRDVEALRRAAAELREALPVDDPRRHSVEAVERATTHLAPLAQHLQQYAAGERAGQEAVDVSALVRDFLAGPEFQEKTKGPHALHVVTNLAPALPPVAASPIRLRRALAEMLAFVTGGAGGERHGALHIATEPAESPDAQGEAGVALRIREARRLSPLQAEGLFEPFGVERDGAQSHAPGFGLAQAALIVEAHGGTLTAEPSPEGTEYVILLPARAAAPEGRPARRPAEAGRHILLVDDHDGHRAEAAELLEALGHRVTPTNGGHEAFERLKDGAPEAGVDLVLLDLVLDDERDGVDVFLDLREAYPDLPVVLAGGFAETDRVAEARELGIAAYLRKPFTEDGLRRVLRQVLGD